ALVEEEVREVAVGAVDQLDRTAILQRQPQTLAVARHVLPVVLEALRLLRPLRRRVELEVGAGRAAAGVASFRLSTSGAGQQTRRGQCRQDRAHHQRMTFQVPSSSTTFRLVSTIDGWPAP